MRRRVPDILIILLLFALPLVMFWQQTVGGLTLIPTDALYQIEPFATYRAEAGAPEMAHNTLVTDLLLENYQWKTLIRENLAQGEIPLWNPHQFAGIPFLAAGQHSALYPFSILYYVLPLTTAYGWFTVLHLWLAGVFMYLFMWDLNHLRPSALLSGVAYQLSAFFVISAVFPMIIAAAAWLPLILMMTDRVIGQHSWRGRRSSVPWVVIGTIALGCNVLAGHIEITYYVLLITAYYAAAQLLWGLIANLSKHRDGATRRDALRHVIQRGAWLVVMVALGIGLGAAQFIPLFELAGMNFREGQSSLEQVLGWAHPARDVIQFAIPNFYGSPAHHNYFDIFTGQTILAPLNNHTIDWGIKNYVEGALYLGILPLALAAFCTVYTAIFMRTEPMPAIYYRPPMIFSGLAIISLTFMFGLPTYGVLYHVFPGINQLHSPFRWVFALTLCVSVLAGYGLDYLHVGVIWSGWWGGGVQLLTPTKAKVSRWIIRGFGFGLTGIGVLALVGLLLSRVFFEQVEPFIAQIVSNMAKAGDVFTDARMFYSYQFPNVLLFGIMALGAGMVFLWAGRPHPPAPSPSGRGGERESRSFLRWRWEHYMPLWQVAAVVLVAVDLMAASWGFNPASDPALLDYKPPAVEWLQAQPGNWRYTTLDDPNRLPLMNANIGTLYGLDDVRGYESIIPKQYVTYMEQVTPQTQLEFNRVAPLYTYSLDQIDWTRLALLNVRYLITFTSVESIGEGEWRLAYEDKAVRIWENEDFFPRAYTFSANAGEAFMTFGFGRGSGLTDLLTPATITTDSGREKLVDVSIDVPSWLVVSETYLPGWRAFIRPQGGTEDDETALDVQLVMGNFQGVELPEAGDWTIRLSYSPPSFQLGLFGSFISVVMLAFISGVYLWRLYVTPQTQGGGVTVVAKNSLAPIILSLFNRGIDFGLAFVMLRILGPEGAGIYYYAAFIFGWFDIFTNFGLNVFLTREVARDRSQAWRLLFNTSALRIGLMLVGVLLLAGFLAARQATVTPPLVAEAVLAMVLLYIGLLPNSLSTGLSALYYAFEKAEIPAAITTIATINRAIFSVIALALGYGVVGLAAVSILTNVVTLAVLAWNARGLVTLTPSLSPSGRGEETSPPAGMHPHPPTPSPLRREGEETRTPDTSPSGGGEETSPPIPLSASREGELRLWRVDRKLIRGMVGESWPLMLNHFLATIFFQIDIVIIEAAHGARMVGQYSVAYKWVAALNVIPAFFTMALLPLMSRQAREDRAALRRNYALAIKLLVSTALPVAVAFTFMAYTLTNILGGAEYLPDGAIATQLMIWSIPIGWINSLTQYVLIALDLQRRITRAFIIAVSFNIISNLLLIPPYGYRAAAVTTIASELVLLIPFAVFLHGALGRIGWVSILWKPVMATGAMLAVLVIGWPIQPFLALVTGTGVYGVVLLALRPLNVDELTRLAPLLPGRVRAFTLRTAGVKTEV